MFLVAAVLATASSLNAEDAVPPGDTRPFPAGTAVPDDAPDAAPAFPPHAILIAAYRGDEGAVRTILAAGADKNVRDSMGATALHAAMFQSNYIVVKLLLDYGFDPNAKAGNGNTPLHNAVTANNEVGARLLLRYGASKRLRNADGFTPFEKARKDGKEMLASLLR